MAPALPGQAVSTASDVVIAGLGAEAEIARLRERLERWLEQVDPELRDSLTWAFAGTPKHFRPLTLFACHRALHGEPDDRAIELAFAIELMHNMSLVIDDVLDESDERRGIDTIQKRFGPLPALMASGYLVADAGDRGAGGPGALRPRAGLRRRRGGGGGRPWGRGRWPASWAPCSRSPRWS